MLSLSQDNKGYLKKLSVLALPIMAQEVVNASINMVDNFMVGSLGIHAVTAVGLANLVFFLFVLILFGVNSGSAIFIGQFWGKRDINSIHKTMGLAFISGQIVAFTFAFCALFMPETIMKFLSDGDPEVIRLGSSYLRIVCFSYFLTGIEMTINISLRCIGQTKLPFLFSLVTLTCKVFLNYLCIFHWNLGVQGAAMATVFVRSIEVTMQIIVVRKLKMPIVSDNLKQYFSFSKQFVKSFYVLTTPVILNEFMWAFGTMLYSVLYKTAGTNGQGAVQIAETMQRLFTVMGMGVGSGCGIMIANALGAGEREKAISYSRKSMVIVIFISLIMAGLMFLIAPFIINYYNVPDIVKEYADKIVIVMACGMFFKNMNFATIIGILRSGGDTKFCLIVDGGAVWLVGLPLVYMGSYVWNWPIYLMVALAYSEELSKFALCIWRVFSNKWANSVVENM